MSGQREAVNIEHRFRSRYVGTCGADPTHPIKAGDLVGWTDRDVVVCQGCVEQAADVAAVGPATGDDGGAG